MATEDSSVDEAADSCKKNEAADIRKKKATRAKRVYLEEVPTDDSDDSSVEDATDVCKKATAKRVYHNRFSGVEAWSDADGRSVFEKHECGAVLEAIAASEYSSLFDGGQYCAASGIQLVKKNEQASGDNSYTRALLCWFHTKARGGCPFAARYVRTDQQYCFYIGTTAHGNHIVDPPAVKVSLAIGSPSIFDKEPEQFKRLFAKRHDDEDLDDQELEKVKRHYSKKRKDYLRKHLPSSANPASVSSMRVTIDNWNRETVRQRCQSTRQFADMMWVCQTSDGLACVLETSTAQEDAKVIVVFTTEELALNAYRQWYHGGKRSIYFQIDASYRYTTNKRVGYIPVKTVSYCQKGHTVAYAVMNTEDTWSQKHILDAVKAAVEYVVNSRLNKGHKYC